MLQYLSALANLSDQNSPSVFPTPFNDKNVERPIKVPLYKELGKTFTEKETSGTQEGELVPTKWSFFLGFLITHNRVDLLLLDWFVVILMYYFFTYFYSVSYELGIELNKNEVYAQAVQQIENEVEESVVEKFKESIGHNDSIQEESEHSFRNSISSRKGSSKKEAMTYVDKVKKKMLIYKLYNSISVGISATSTIISLVCLLMIAFQVQGFINLFYICFCLYFIAQAINFIYQKNWKFPLYLRRILKPMVILEILIQMLYQTPVDAVHKNEADPKSWQKIIGFYPIWSISDDNIPISISTSNVIYKCFMYAFIILQENIFESKEYKSFTNITLFDIQRLSDQKAEAMAYLYNNGKIKTTISNQFEKDKMIRKLAQVNRQLKQWNQSVFNKSDQQPKFKPLEASSSKEIKNKKKIEETKIKEASEHEEEDKEESSLTQDPKLKTIDSSVESEPAIDEYDGLNKNELSKKLAQDRLSLPWQIYILGVRYATNQVLIVFSYKRLDMILEQVENGETKIYLGLEEKLIQDYETDKATMKEFGYKTFEKIPKDKKSKLVEKATKGYQLVIAYISLIFNIMLSNTSFACYLLMIVDHIMNGSIVSLVYPFSIFIYALLEERRPKNSYWKFIIIYSSLILILKFLLQTYPISDWLTNGEVVNNNTGSTKTSVNDILRSMRLGLEVIVQGKNFVNYFLFEALILLLGKNILKLKF